MTKMTEVCVEVKKRDDEINARDLGLFNWGVITQCKGHNAVKPGHLVMLFINDTLYFPDTSQWGNCNPPIYCRKIKEIKIIATE